ncbi:MAG: histidinol-phosphate transaminase [Oscillospiraceae bacterium]|jgi:histidinol-phosphate aminotransferase
MKSRFFDPKLRRLEPYVPGEQPANMAEFIKLNANENPFSPSPKVAEALTKAVIDDLRLYPDAACTRLVTALAETCGVGTDQVIPANGSDELLAFCFHGLCPNGAVFADITYSFYPVFADMFGIPYEIVPLREDFTIQVADYAGKQGTIFLANPNAPTGLCLPLSEIEVLLQQDPDRLVVVDEAYVDFGAESAVALVDRYDNLLVTQTFSKSRQLAGGRLAFAVGNADLIGDMNAMKFSFNPFNVDAIAITMGEAILRDPAYFEDCRKKIVDNRAYTTRELKKLGFVMTESLTNFVFAKPPAGLSAAAYQAALRAHRILIRYFSAPRVNEYVRITIGTREDMEALIAATIEILKARAAQ